MNTAEDDLKPERNQLTELYEEMNAAKKDMLNNTKWSSLLTSDYIKNLNDDSFTEHLKNQNLLKDNSIRWERLGDHDAGALKVWAEVLSHDDTANPKTLLKLCNHILNVYFPEDFDVYLVWEKVLDNVCKQNGNDRWTAEKEACTKMIQASIKNWLDQDPVHYFSQYWARKYFGDKEADELIKFYCKAIEINTIQELNEMNHVYYNLLGTHHHRQGKYPSSIFCYKKAIRLNRNTPIYHCNLGNTYGKLRKPDWNRMIKHCGKAVDLRKKYPEDNYDLNFYYDFFAEAHFRDKKLNKFEEKFKADHD